MTVVAYLFALLVLTVVVNAYTVIRGGLRRERNTAGRVLVFAAAPALVLTCMQVYFSWLVLVALSGLESPVYFVRTEAVVLPVLAITLYVMAAVLYALAVLASRVIVGARRVVRSRR